MKKRSEATDIRADNWKQFATELQYASLNKRQDVRRVWSDHVDHLRLGQENAERERDIRDGLFVDPVAPSQPVYQGRYKSADKMGRPFSPSSAWFSKSREFINSPEAQRLKSAATSTSHSAKKHRGRHSLTHTPPRPRSVGTVRPVSAGPQPSFDGDYLTVLKEFVVPSVDRNAISSLVSDSASRTSWLQQKAIASNYTEPRLPLAPSTSLTPTETPNPTPYIDHPTATTTSRSRSRSPSPPPPPPRPATADGRYSFGPSASSALPPRPSTAEPAAAFASLEDASAGLTGYSPATLEDASAGGLAGYPPGRAGERGGGGRASPSRHSAAVRAGDRGGGGRASPSRHSAAGVRAGDRGGGGEGLSPTRSNRSALAPTASLVSLAPTGSIQSTTSGVDESEQSKRPKRRGAKIGQDLALQEAPTRPLDPRAIDRCTPDQLRHLEYLTKRQLSRLASDIHKIEKQLTQVPHHTSGSMFVVSNTATRGSSPPLPARDCAKNNIQTVSNHRPDVKFAMRITKAIEREHHCQQSYDRAQAAQAEAVARRLDFRNRHEALRQERVDIEQKEERERLAAAMYEIRCERQRKWLVLVSLASVFLKYHKIIFDMRIRMAAASTIQKIFLRHRCLRYTHYFVLLRRVLRRWIRNRILWRNRRAMTVVLTWCKEVLNKHDLIKIMKHFALMVRTAQRIVRSVLLARRDRRLVWNLMWQRVARAELAIINKKEAAAAAAAERTGSRAPPPKPTVSPQKKGRKMPSPLAVALEGVRESVLQAVWRERVDEYNCDRKGYLRQLKEYRHQYHHEFLKIEAVARVASPKTFPPNEKTHRKARRRMSLTGVRGNQGINPTEKLLESASSQPIELLEGISLPPPPQKPVFNGFIRRHEMKELVKGAIVTVRLKLQADQAARQAEAEAEAKAQRNRRRR